MRHFDPLVLNIFSPVAAHIQPARWSSFLLLSLLLVTAFPSLARSQDSLPDANILARHGLEMGWWGYAVINPQRDKIEQVSITETQVFLQSDSGMVTAFNAETGSKMWAARVGNYDSSSFPVTTNEQYALIISGLRIYCLNRFTGQQLWELEIPSYPSTPVAMDDQNLYFGTIGGVVFAYRLEKVKELFEAAKLPQFTASAEAWRYRASQEITTQPLTNGRVVSFASRDGSVYTVSANQRRLIYQFETDAPIVAPLTSNGSQLFVASQDYNNYSIDLETGMVQWHFVSGFPIKNAPISVGSQLFVVPEGGGLFSVNAATGLAAWNGSVEDVNHFLSATPSKVYGSDYLKNMLIVDRRTGKLESKIHLPQFNIWTANARTDRLFLCHTDGLIVMLREQKREFPVYHQHPELRPIVPEFATDSMEETPADAQISPEIDR